MFRPSDSIHSFRRSDNSGKRFLQDLAKDKLLLQSSPLGREFPLEINVGFAMLRMQRALWGREN